MASPVSAASAGAAVLPPSAATSASAAPQITASVSAANGGKGKGGPGAEAVDQALLVGHEMRTEDKRFTVYKLELQVGKTKTMVFHRYSEFRELYQRLKEQYPKERLSFPSKRLFGSNFDPEFLEARQRGLHEFIQKVIQNKHMCADPAVREFLLAKPRHGRGHTRELSVGDLSLEDKRVCVCVGVCVCGASSSVCVCVGVCVCEGHFDLGQGENKRACVEDFAMLKVIGKGSFGKVFLSRHKASGALYAVKVLTKAAIIAHNEVKHIMSERNVLLGNVHHPFLVGLHFSFQTNTKLYFVLDYVNGGELFFHLQREKKFSVARVTLYAAELTSALGYLHSLNIVYRDLKPENILFSAEGHVVLTDFGLCKENIKTGQTTHTFCGTPEYLAPEVLQKREYGRSVDWWCLGCVVYEMLCGLPPFYSRDINEMYTRILHDRLRFPEHVQGRARELLEGLLRRDPSERLGSGVEDCEEVKRQPFFEGLDWRALDAREIRPPWSPSVDDGLDLKNIDPDFVNEPIPESVMDAGDNVITVKVSDAFTGFSYSADDYLTRDQ